MRKRGKRNQRHAKAAVVILSVAVGIGIFFLSRDKGPDCKKWLYSKSLNRKINSVDEAIAVMKSAFPDEKRFAGYPVPETVEGFRKIYNLAPFLKVSEVREKSGIYVIKEVYDLLLGLYLDREGNVYKYNDCSLLL